MKAPLLMLTLTLAACSVDLQRRAAPVVPLDLGISSPCVVTFETEHSMVTIDLGEVGAVAVREAAGRATTALREAGAGVPPVLVSLAAGLVQGAVDAGLCRAFEVIAGQVPGVTVTRPFPIRP